jgi:hypothetical protein
MQSSYFFSIVTCCENKVEWPLRCRVALSFEPGEAKVKKLPTRRRRDAQSQFLDLCTARSRLKFTRYLSDSSSGGKDLHAEAERRGCRRKLRVLNSHVARKCERKRRQCGGRDFLQAIEKGRFIAYAH